MNQPVVVDSKHKAVIPFYIVAAPGKAVEPATIKPEVHVLTWNFASMDRGDLIDLVQSVDLQMSALEKWVKGAREVLKQTLEQPSAENPQVVVPGRKFQAQYTYSIRRALDQEKIKADMGDQWILEHTKETPVYTLKIVPIPQTPGVAG